MRAGRGGIILWVVGAFLLLPAGVSGQIGALAAAAAAAGGEAGGEYALAGAPIFAESGMVLDQGWALGAFGVTTGTSMDFSDPQGGSGTLDVSVTSLSLGGFAAVGERAMVGAVLVPYASAEVSIGNSSASSSGLGDLNLFGKLALSEGPRTRLAATASVGLPVGEDDVSAGSTTLSVGVGASHVLDPRTSLHGGVALGFSSSDSEDEGGDGTLVGFNGAVVRSLSERAWLSGELLGNSTGGAWSVLLAPGFRYRAQEQLFVDVGLAFGLLSSDDVEPLDYGLAAGVTWVPRR